jgi:xanthine dehydrogenase accessory factor
MKCGGYVEVFIEPVSTPFKLLIFGGGHIGKALSDIASNLSFSVSVIDERSEIFSDYRQNNVNIIIENFEDYLSRITIDNYTFIVVVTKGHETDLAILKKCIRSNYAYIGVIGSQRKSAELKKTLIEGGFCDPKDYEKVHIPVGTQIMAEGPFEIAVSIASELILQKNKLLNEINSSKES